MQDWLVGAAQRENRVPVLTEEAFRQSPVVTKLAFSRLLEWVDDGVDSHGERYVEMRNRLVVYFDRRNRLSADELADETLNRIARTLERDGRIETTPPARYCFVVARFVLLEDIRRERVQVPLDERRTAVRSAAPGTALERVDDAVETEMRLESLDRCLEQLKPDQRDLIVEYYRGARQQKIEHRRELAKRLGISMNALGIRVSRIRAALELCVEGACRVA